MSADPRSAVAELRRLGAEGALDDFCVEHGIRLLVVFGSVLDEERRPRDLDLAVLLAPGADLVGVTSGLISLLGCDAVDVLDLGRAELVARAAALEGEPLFEDRPGLYAQLQMATLPLAAETAWIRRLQLEQLAE
jgi:predicted nucleotidyltransferase